MHYIITKLLKVDTLQKYQSSCNILTKKLFNHISFKTYAFIEKVTDQIPLFHNVYKLDMIKCRRNNVYYNKINYPKYSVMDKPEIFTGLISEGFYYVISDNYFPLRGNGWYSMPMVNYCLEQNIILIDDITMELKPSEIIKHEILKNDIDTLLDASKSNKTIQKILANSLFGLFGVSKTSSTINKFTLSLEEASQDIDKENIFIRQHNLDENNTLYQKIINTEINNDITAYPMYKQILDLEALELHKLESKIIKKGGVILDRNTDAIRYASKTEIIIDDCYNDSDIKKYQSENAKGLKIESMKGFFRKKIIVIDEYQHKWKTQYNNNNVDELIRGSFTLQGNAGTGKTYLVNKIIDKLKETNKRYICLSPTNKGALLIGGSTIHSYYYKYKSNKKKITDILQKTEYIFVDEISMMETKFYQLLLNFKMMKPKLKFILIGDYDQLAPVDDFYKGDHSNSQALYELADSNKIYLTICRRSNNELYNLCNLVKNGKLIDTSPFKYKQFTYKNIAYTNKTRKDINEICMTRFTTNKEFLVVLKNDKNDKSQDMKLCVNMPVICYTTNKKLSIFNNQQFKIKSIDDDKIILDNDIEIKTDQFKYYFIPAFCVTIHASQGETINEPYTIWDYDNDNMCQKSRYVALSRSTNIENIQIVNNKKC